MDKKLTFLGGEPDINIDDLLRDPVANRAALFGLVDGITEGNDAKIKGAAVTTSAGVDAFTTAGYIYLNGEILQVDSATVLETLGTDNWEFQKQITYDSAGDKTFNDATPRQTWQKNRAILVNVVTVTGFDAVNGRGLVYDSGWKSLAADANVNVTRVSAKQKGDSVTIVGNFSISAPVGSPVFTLPAGVSPPTTDDTLLGVPFLVADNGGNQPPVVFRAKGDGTIVAIESTDLTTGRSYEFSVTYIIG